MNQNELNEGRKDAGVDRSNNKKKRPLNRYSPSYQQGYNEKWQETEKTKK